MYFIEIFESTRHLVTKQNDEINMTFEDLKSITKRTIKGENVHKSGEKKKTSRESENDKSNPNSNIDLDHLKYSYDYDFIDT